MTIYRILDVCADNTTSICYIYLVDIKGEKCVAKLTCVYEILIGSKGSGTSLDVAMKDTIAKYINDIVVEDLRNVSTWYRGMQRLLRIRCKSRKPHTKILDDITYNKFDQVYLCNGYCTVEDVTMMRNGLYGVLYVELTGKKLSPAAERDYFEYNCRVGGFDLETTTLDPADPSGEIYMAAYYCDEKYYIVYLSSYLPDDLPPVGNYIYIRVDTKSQLASTLADIIIKDSPDVLVGYNIYNFDVPMLYFALRSELLDWPNVACGPRTYYHNTRKLEKKFADSEAGITVKIPGVHTIDMYTYLDKALPSEDKVSLSLDDVSKRYLNDFKHPMDHTKLTRVYHTGDREQRLDVMYYCGKDAMLPTKLYSHFNLDNYYASTYMLTGIDPQRTITHGDVATTYGMCYKEACSRQIYLDEPNVRIFKPGGGLVLDSIRGYYENIDCVDLTSLYPNIVIQHGIDAASLVPKWEADRLNLQQRLGKCYYEVLPIDTSVHVLHNSRGDNRYIRSTNPTAVLPRVLERTLQQRAIIKEQIKALKENGGTEQQIKILQGRELAAKTASNSACGALGEQSKGNPMSHCELNDLITSTGRSILKVAVRVANNMGVKVIYGDTDSLFVDSQGRTEQFINAIHDELPNRIRFKLEYTASKFIMGKKKHYIAVINGKLKVSGYKSTKSSKCLAVKNLFLHLVDTLLLHGPQTAYHVYNEALSLYCSAEQVDVKLLSCSFRYSGKDYAPTTYQAKIVQNMRNRGLKLVPGDNRPVVIVHSHESYVAKYGMLPAVKLPSSSKHKSDFIYTLEEIDSNPALIDIASIFAAQCKPDLDEVVDSYMSNLNA